jgi:predicted DNA-binding transcriptional regulator YafY
MPTKKRPAPKRRAAKPNTKPKPKPRSKVQPEPSAPPAPSTPAGPAYAPARRFEAARAVIAATGGVTVYELAERLEVSVRTAIRYLDALQAQGEPIYSEREGRKLVYRVQTHAERSTVQLTTAQMASLFLSRRVFDFLEGTGFKEDLDDIFTQLERALRRRDFERAKNLDRKLFVVNDAPYVYEGRLDDVNEILTALLNEERLTIVHRAVARGGQAFGFDPYTLLVYKKGLYVAGHSHHHGGLRTFALAGLREVDRQKGARFEYPEDYTPESLTEGTFGLIGGPKTRVTIFFDRTVARFVERRQWHPSQQLVTVEGGVELTLEIQGTVELESWILSFGDKAEVRAPASLRAALRGQLERALARYASAAMPAPLAAPDEAPPDDGS